MNLNELEYNEDDLVKETLFVVSNYPYTELKSNKFIELFKGLVEIIKDQSAEISELKKDLRELDNRFEDFKYRVSNGVTFY